MSKYIYKHDLFKTSWYYLNLIFVDNHKHWLRLKITPCSRENTRSSRVSLRSTKSSTTLVHEDAPPVDPLELTQAAENLETNLEPPQDDDNAEEGETNDHSDDENE